MSQKYLGPLLRVSKGYRQDVDWFTFLFGGFVEESTSKFSGWQNEFSCPLLIDCDMEVMLRS